MEDRIRAGAAIHKRAFATLPALLLVLLLTHVVAFTFYKAYAALMLEKDEQSSATMSFDRTIDARLAALSRAFEAPALTFSCSGSICGAGKTAPAGILKQRLISGLSDPFPLVDYGPVFGVPDECPGRIAAAAPSFRLSTAAARSAQDCLLADPAAAGVLSITRNIRAAHLALQRDVQPAIASAAGYIELDTLSLATASALVLAGGDVRIRRVQATAPAAELTLVSATGAVLIDELQDGIKIRIFGREGVFAPSGSEQEASSVLPPIVVWEVLCRPVTG